MSLSAADWVTTHMGELEDAVLPFLVERIPRLLQNWDHNVEQIHSETYASRLIVWNRELEQIHLSFIVSQCESGMNTVCKLNIRFHASQDDMTGYQAADYYTHIEYHQGSWVHTPWMMRYTQCDDMMGHIYFTTEPELAPLDKQWSLLEALE